MLHFFFGFNFGVFCCAVKQIGDTFHPQSIHAVLSTADNDTIYDLAAVSSIIYIYIADIVLFFITC